MKKITTRVYKLVIAYDGTDYHGWQIQPQPDISTITGVLQDAFNRVFKRDCKIIGASRTDAGVHASGQVAKLTTDFDIDSNILKTALNNVLPAAINICSVESVDSDFHPQAQVLSKIYIYTIYLEQPSPFIARYGYYLKDKLSQKFNIKKLEEALSIFVGTHDFRSFCTGYEKENTVRTIDFITIEPIEAIKFSSQICGYKIKFVGAGFLRYMIRRIMGASLDYAVSKKKFISELQKALDEKNPEQTFSMAPAAGLNLYKINYKNI